MAQNLALRTLDDMSEQLTRAISGRGAPQDRRGDSSTPRQQRSGQERVFRVEDINNPRRYVIVTGVDDMTEEKEKEILSHVYGEGAVSKSDLATGGGIAGSIIGGEASKRQFARQAGRGLRSMPLGSVLRRIPAVGAAAGIGAAGGEFARQQAIGPSVGGYRIAEVNEDLFGVPEDWSRWSPDDPVSRAKMGAIRGTQEFLGENVLGGLGTLLGATGRGMYRMAQGGAPGSPLTTIMGNTLEQGPFARVRGNPPGQIHGSRTPFAEQMLRQGAEGSPSARWLGRSTPRTAVGEQTQRVLRSALPVGVKASARGQRNLAQLPRMIAESRDQTRAIVSSVADQPVVGLKTFNDLDALKDEVFIQPGPKGWTVKEWANIRPEIDSIFRGSEKPQQAEIFHEIFNKYLVTPELDSFKAPTIGQMAMDIEKLEIGLDDIYHLIDTGMASKGSVAQVFGKGLRDVLTDRMGQSLQSLDTAWRPPMSRSNQLFKDWTDQKSMTQLFNNTLDVVKKSPDTAMSGLALGGLMMGGGAGAAIGGDPESAAYGALSTLPLMAFGGSPPLGARMGQMLYNMRGSQVPGLLARSGVIGATEDQPVSPPPDISAANLRTPVQTAGVPRRQAVGRPSMTDQMVSDLTDAGKRAYEMVVGRWRDKP